MALTLNLVVIPVLAGLVAGTGAVASFVSGSPGPSGSAARMEQSCTAQTWPYIDSKCLAGNEQKRVRLVAAPRADETPDTLTSPTAVSPAPAPKDGDRAATPPMLTSRDTVLRQGDISPAPKVTRPRGKRSEQRRWIAQSYQVPAESRTRSGAVIVVRPLALDRFR